MKQGLYSRVLGMKPCYRRTTPPINDNIAFIQLVLQEPMSAIDVWSGGAYRVNINEEFKVR
jgi:hypothetical protein